MRAARVAHAEPADRRLVEDMSFIIRDRATLIVPDDLVINIARGSFMQL